VADREDRVAARALYDTGRFTMEQIADLLGTSKSSVSRWLEKTPTAEKPVVGPNEARVQSWAGALDMSDTVLAMRVDAMLTLAFVVDVGRRAYAKGIDRQAAVAATKELMGMVDNLGSTDGFEDLRKALLAD
jgi:hypothetical protein